MKREIKVLKSLKKQYAYLFLDQSKNFADLPSELQRSFGDTSLVLEMELSLTSKFARAKPENVLMAIEEKGFYLQLPPTLDDMGANRH